MLDGAQHLLTGRFLEKPVTPGWTEETRILRLQTGLQGDLSPGRPASA
ncbi:hypothetical protein J2848_003405 [Azospirillum lipoferum]|nr:MULTISPECIES: hypothetical protein [Azospirillum]MCP1611727.1 hypothetical protein [Azospirillum lipoferum]MDW5533515.1 hypothetical protein [Azospirillum sp. NL1]